MRGCYAVSVNGVVPHHIALELQDKRIPLASRNRQFDPSQDLARLSAAAAASSAPSSSAGPSFAVEPVRDTIDQVVEDNFE